jgi:hypothetical protein
MFATTGYQGVSATSRILFQYHFSTLNQPTETFCAYTLAAIAQSASRLTAGWTGQRPNERSKTRVRG